MEKREKRIILLNFDHVKRGRVNVSMEELNQTKITHKRNSTKMETADNGGDSVVLLLVLSCFTITYMK